MGRSVGGLNMRTSTSPTIYKTDKTMMIKTAERAVNSSTTRTTMFLSVFMNNLFFLSVQKFTVIFEGGIEAEGKSAI